MKLALEKTLSNRENQAVLERIFSGTTARILDHLITMDGFDFTVNEICKILDISYKVVLTTLKQLEKMDLVENSKFRPIKWKRKDNIQTQYLRKFVFEVATNDIKRSAVSF